jgi:hypothetical protein
MPIQDACEGSPVALPAKQSPGFGDGVVSFLVSATALAEHVREREMNSRSVGEVVGRVG